MVCFAESKKAMFLVTYNLVYGYIGLKSAVFMILG